MGNSVEGRFALDTGDQISIRRSVADGPKIGFGPDDMQDGRIVKAAHTSAKIGGLVLELGSPHIAIPMQDDIAKDTSRMCAAPWPIPPSAIVSCSSTSRSIAFACRRP